MRVDLPLDQKTVENQDWATGPLWDAGRWAFGPPGRRGPWAAGLLLAKPDELNIDAGKNVLACFKLGIILNE